MDRWLLLYFLSLSLSLSLANYPSITQEFNDVWMLPYTRMWHRVNVIGNLPPLVNSAAVAVDHLIYIFGGFSNGRALANLFVLNTSAASF